MGARVSTLLPHGGHIRGPVRLSLCVVIRVPTGTASTVKGCAGSSLSFQNILWEVTQQGHLRGGFFWPRPCHCEGSSRSYQVLLLLGFLEDGDQGCMWGGHTNDYLNQREMLTFRSSFFENFFPDSWGYLEPQIGELQPRDTDRRCFLVEFEEGRQAGPLLGERRRLSGCCDTKPQRAHPPGAVPSLLLPANCLSSSHSAAE